MSEFTVREVEGMRQVRIDIDGETVRARAGALSKSHGRIHFVPRIPRVGEFWRALFTDEARVRPYYSGSGTILLQPSLGGFHVAEVVAGERWILEPGVYWASDGDVDISLYRERFWPSLWAGDGLLVWKTVVQGNGRIALNTPGPVETMEIEDGEMRVQGRLVLGRTDGLRFHSERSAPFPRNFISGQRRMRVFRGTGKLLVCWTPYWNQHMYQNLTGETIERSLFE